MLSHLDSPSRVFSAPNEASISSPVSAMHSQSPSQQPGPLERLPLHIAQYLLDFVDDRRSIFAFSLASKFCCQAAAPQRFARLRLTIRDKEKLCRDLDQLKRVLAVDNRFAHVRRVTLKGFLLCGNDHIGPNAVDGRFLANGGWNEVPQDDDGDSETEDIADLTYFAPDLPRYTAQRKQEQNEAWQPFADFLGQLPALRDFVYACTHQIPPCVLTALHQHHPKSRLHMHTFSLRSLYQDRDKVHDIDLDEFSLVTSPCLYSINVKYEPDSSRGETSYNREAVEWLVENSSSLREVRLHHSHPGNSLALQNAIRLPRPAWEGFFRQDSPNKSMDKRVPEQLEKHPLESLVFRLEGFDTGLEHFGMWRRLRSLTHLRHLEISPCTSADVEDLVSMAANNELCSLRDLVVYYGGSSNTLGSLLSALPRLETLKLSGTIDETTIAGILNGPRPTLRKLQIYPDENKPLSDYYVRQLVQCCPNLEDVRLRIRRYMYGGPERLREAAMYRSVGQSPRLRRVVLQLCSRPPYLYPIPALMSPKQDQLQDFRRALVDVAVDETLARAIFQRISATRCPLERLKIQTLPLRREPFQPSVDGDWEAIANVVGGRSWLCTRVDTESAELRVREININDFMRECAVAALKDVDENTLKLWNAIWPAREGGNARWWDNWWSYPLTDILDDDGEDVTGGAGPNI
ncbi:hypothetical protein B0T21DRAFT_360694 [Apiosordaria backusii]|uniref:Uncharacterized protein n=1 Tax=Apiosordaria backusii TaxID=314023 RepID=A0AA40EMP5_9PEZI|nr:hypothetical protein B0T21DRAFT_360694 [Apiosordaria backusii]